MSDDNTEIGITSLNGSLEKMLLGKDIQPGDDPSYQLVKDIYLYHPLGGKMVDSPITMAQSEPREITVQDAPEEVLQAFEKEWEALSADDHIANVTRLSRIYGIASIILGCESVKGDKPLEMSKLWELKIWFSELDPLNTAGSLVLNQVPTNPDFNKPARVSVNGQNYHPSRFEVLMNEAPVYLAYTNSAFGFSGRSVYQRALYPLKSFIRTMIADDMIATKLALLIAKQKSPGSVIDKVMTKIAGIKRVLLKFGKSGEVLSIGHEDEIETLNMQNVDGAGTYSRNNIIKNIATAADMPAKLLDNETMVEGFGEGTEDAKAILRYVNGVRKKMQPVYVWFDNIVRYRAWNPQFYAGIQAKYPARYKDIAYEDAFSEWRTNFAAEWPSLLMEPESEQIKVEQTKLEALVGIVQVLSAEVDPSNKARLFQWLADNVGENKMLFPHELDLDYEDLQVYLRERQKQQQDQAAGLGSGEEDGEVKKLPRFDSVTKKALPRLPGRRSQRLAV